MLGHVVLVVLLQTGLKLAFFGIKLIIRKLTDCQCSVLLCCLCGGLLNLEALLLQ